MKKWKLISSKFAFDHRWFKVRQDVVELPTGKILDDYFVWPEGDVAMVVPVTKQGEFVLVEQYKHAAGNILIEFPAGMIEKDEKPEDAARRELVEETGYTSENIILLGTLVNSPTKVVSTLYVYLAKNAVKNNSTAFDENEEISVHLKTYPELMKMIDDGSFYVSGSVSAAFMAGRKLGL